MTQGVYSKALRFIYNTGAAHGDPHLGNVLIFRDSDGLCSHEFSSQMCGLRVKLADTGTSEFWYSREDILSREAMLIFETAERLFADRNFEKLWFHPSGLSYQDTLLVLDALCECISSITSCTWDDRCASQNAIALAELVVRVPLFGVEELISQIGKTGYTTVNAFARRLNQRLLDMPYFMPASDIIGPNTKRLYAKARDRFIQERVLPRA